MKQLALCVSRKALPLSSGLMRFDTGIISQDQFHFINRDTCDSKDNGSDKIVGYTLPQILPYIVVTFRDEVLTYSRSKTGGESRLMGSRSIGFGGHIDLVDYAKAIYELGAESTFQASICNAANRELSEELGLANNHYSSTNQFSNIILDDSNEVGKVHCGVVSKLPIDSKELININHEIADPVWVKVSDLLKDIDLYENWSKLLIVDLNN